MLRQLWGKCATPKSIIIKKKTNKPLSRWSSSISFKNKHSFGLHNFFARVCYAQSFAQVVKPKSVLAHGKPQFIWLHLDHDTESWVHNCCLDTAPVPMSLNYFTLQPLSPCVAEVLSVQSCFIPGYLIPISIRESIVIPLSILLIEGSIGGTSISYSFMCK